MSQSPYTPPSSRVADDEEAPAPFPRPKQVRLAVGLLWVSLALGIPLWYFAASRDPEIGFHPAFLAFVDVTFALSAALNVLIYRGRNWARIVVLILFLLGAVFLLFPIGEQTPPGAVETVLNALCFVIDLIALYLLFSAPGKLWFRPRE